MSLPTIYDLLTDGDVTPSAAAVYKALVMRRRRTDRTAWPSIATIRRDTGGRFSERTVQRAIRTLEKLGFVVRQESRLSYLDPKFGAFVRWGRQTSNTYKITTHEERAEIVKKDPATAAPSSAPQRHPMGDKRVTPYVGTSEDSKREETPHVPPLNRGGQTSRPPPPRQKARAKELHPETGPVLTWWRGRERERLHREPDALPAGPVQVIDQLIRAFGVSQARAVLTLYRQDGFSWSTWAKEHGYPIGRLADVNLVRTIMGQRVYPVVRRRVDSELAAAAAAVLRSGSVGQILAGILGGPSDSS